MNNKIVKITVVHSSFDAFTDILIRRANGKARQYTCTKYSRSKETMLCSLENRLPTRITFTMTYISIEYLF